ncbi:DUF1127 domain-containing protein [Roseibium algae]|uniref:DUF1127 domain-containing protein n=1 Tax=Roseibium algae TaxID=3123038 RepID=A0ABU8TKG2_9HYPH
MPAKVLFFPQAHQAASSEAPAGSPFWRQLSDFAATSLNRLPAKIWSAPYSYLILWIKRSQTRSQLHSELLSEPDSVFADLKLNRADIEREAAKPFWRA